MLLWLVFVGNCVGEHRPGGDNAAAKRDSFGGYIILHGTFCHGNRGIQRGPLCFCYVHAVNMAEHTTEGKRILTI